MPQDFAWCWTAVEVRDAVRNGDISCVEMVESVYARIDAVNPTVNAIVHMDRARALKDAAALDVARQAGRELGPLAGVPVSIKLNVDVAGEATSNGTPLWLLGAVFCRDSDQPIAPSEAQFIAGAVQVRN